MKKSQDKQIRSCSIPIFQRLLIHLLILQKSQEAKLEPLKCVKVPDLHKKFLHVDNQVVIRRKQALFRRKHLSINNKKDPLVDLPQQEFTHENSEHHFSHLKVKQPKDLPASMQTKPPKKNYTFTAIPM